MRPYLAILSARFRVLLQYRAAALAGFGTQLFWGLIRMMIFTAFYNSSSSVQPMTLRQTIAYVWLGQALLLLIPFRSDSDVDQLVRTGNVSFELLRPVDTYWLWYARGIALRVAPVLLRAVPMFIVAFLAGWLPAPASPGAAAGFLLALPGAVLLSTAISTLAAVSLFWTISGEGLSRLIPMTTWLLSGIAVPLPLFPEWSQRALSILPFRGILDTPFRLYIGILPPAQLSGLIAQQLAWSLALILLARFLLSRGVRRLVIQGG